MKIKCWILAIVTLSLVCGMAGAQTKTSVSMASIMQVAGQKMGNKCVKSNGGIFIAANDTYTSMAWKLTDPNNNVVGNFATSIVPDPTREKKCEDAKNCCQAIAMR